MIEQPLIVVDLTLTMCIHRKDAVVPIHHAWEYNFTSLQSLCHTVKVIKYAINISDTRWRLLIPALLIMNGNYDIVLII